MTIAIAKECGASVSLDGFTHVVKFSDEELAAYEARIRADQRERDAKHIDVPWARAGSEFAAAIRSGEGERT